MARGKEEKVRPFAGDVTPFADRDELKKALDRVNGDVGGYHVAKIPKGEIGFLSKIDEEVAELRDSVDQGNSIMALCEIADIYGALEAFIEKRYPGISMEDIKKMSDATRRAFASGRRR